MKTVPQSPTPIVAKAPKPGVPPLLQGAYNAKDAAHYCGISRSELYRLLSAERIKSAKLGKIRLILRSELDRFLESLMEEAG